MKSSPTGSSSGIKALLAAFLMTGLAIYAYKFLPQRELVIIPGDDFMSFYVDTNGSSITQLNNRKSHFRCTYTPSSKYCGLDIRQGDGLANGVDLSIYDEMSIQANYTGEAKIIRFFIRNFSPDFSTMDDAQNTSKYIRSLIPAGELSEHLVISLNEFSIPGWWVRLTGIPRDLSHPEFTNVVHLGIDVPTPAPSGNHTIELKSIRLTGLYLTKDNWYLLILAAWGAVLLIIAIKRDIDLKRASKLTAENLEKEKVKSVHLKQVSDKYKELALLDTLSGVFNRRGIYQFYDNSFAEKSNSHDSIVMLDIDHFKEVNDHYGHNVGDNVIEKIGEILRNTVRDQDIIGRWGGEEFIILCLNTDIDGATFLAEKIRAAVESHTFTDQPELHITASLGVGPINPKMRFEENVKHTDLAMYKAKSSGRNCWYTTS